MRYILIIFLFCLISCEKNDANFRLTTEESYFLVQENTGEKHIISFTKENVNPNWTAYVAKIGDICGENNAFWVSDIANNNVKATFYNKKGEDTKTYSTENIVPHILGIGEKYLLVGDSINKKLLFMHKKNGKIEATKTLEKKPSRIIYKFAKFYVVTEKEIQVFDEQAIALRNTIQFRHEITDLQIAPTALFANSFGNDSLYEANISIFENEIHTNIRKTYQQIVYSPYNRAVFGTETVGNCILNNGKLTLNNVAIFPQLDSIAHIEVDFFTSNFYFQRHGNIYEHNLDESISGHYISFSGKILKAVYRQDYIQ